MILAWWAFIREKDPLPNGSNMAALPLVLGDEDPLMTTRTEQVKSCQSLVCLLQALSGTRTTIELRNEISIEGVVSSVDVHMK